MTLRIMTIMVKAMYCIVGAMTPAIIATVLLMLPLEPATRVSVIWPTLFFVGLLFATLLFRWDFIWRGTIFGPSNR